MDTQPYCKKIMVIDDNEIDRYIAEMNIEGEEFASEIILKESAKAGLEYLLSLEQTAELLPEIIFLDIRMPDMDGFGFLDEYNKLPEVIRKRSIIMMLSSSLNEDDHERAKGNEYVSRFLTKPLDKNKLTELKSSELKHESFRIS